jgi:hypothetical protein
MTFIRAEAGIVLFSIVSLPGLTGQSSNPGVQYDRGRRLLDARFRGHDKSNVDDRVT